MADQRAADIIGTWPEESREAAQLVIDEYGEPHEATAAQLTWHDVGPWKRMVATRAFYDHNFPAPHPLTNTSSGPSGCQCADTSAMYSPVGA